MERKSNAASEQTKYALAAALKELMTQKSFDRITIHDLTERCSIRRQSFYYHFRNVYDLLRWMFQEEAVALLRQHEGALLWQEGLLQLFRYIEDNRAVCLCALKSIGREQLKYFFQADIHAIIHRAVEQIGTDVGAIQAGVTQDDVALMTHIYVIASASVLESWLQGEIDRTPEQLVTLADQILRDHIRGAEMRWHEQKKGADTCISTPLESASI